MAFFTNNSPGPGGRLRLPADGVLDLGTPTGERKLIGSESPDRERRLLRVWA